MAGLVLRMNGQKAADQWGIRDGLDHQSAAASAPGRTRTSRRRQTKLTQPAKTPPPLPQRCPFELGRHERGTQERERKSGEW